MENEEEEDQEQCGWITHQGMDRTGICRICEEGIQQETMEIHDSPTAWSSLTPDDDDGSEDFGLSCAQKLCLHLSRLESIKENNSGGKFSHERPLEIQWE